MKRQPIIMSALVLLLGLGILAACSVSRNAMTIPTSEEAGVSFQTTPSHRPEGSSCLNEAGEAGLAKELVNISSKVVVVNGDHNPMPDEEWNDYNPRLPWLKNINRNTMFSNHCFYRSPGIPADCQGDGCRTIQEIAGHTWIELSIIEAQDCISTGDAQCTSDTVDPSAILVTVTQKCHQIIFEEEIYQLRDPAGNLYVMHASDTMTPDLNPTLPDGWTLSVVTLDDPLEVLPFGGSDECYYNVLRDNLGQGYHQYFFVDEQYPSP
jgi:hypothetical protein